MAKKSDKRLIAPFPKKVRLIGEGVEQGRESMKKDVLKVLTQVFENAQASGKYTKHELDVISWILMNIKKRVEAL